MAKNMAKNTPECYVESVNDLIDDTAQILHRMPEGTYFDRDKNVIIIEKSSGATTMTIGQDDIRLIVTCSEMDGMGKITKIVWQNSQGKKDIYWSSRFATYNRCIMGERGKLMMRRLIDKLQYCTRQKTATGAQVIHLDVRRRALPFVETVTNLAAAFERPE